jgi:hypothetical protein
LYPAAERQPRIKLFLPGLFFGLEGINRHHQRYHDYVAGKFADGLSDSAGSAIDSKPRWTGGRE